MSAALQLLPAMQQIQSAESDDLLRIFASDVNLVAWQRDVPADISPYLAQLTSLPSLQLQRVAALDTLPSALNSLLPEGQGKDAFVADICLLSDILCCLMDCNAVGVRLKLLTTPMCPRFHTDHVALRLLVTYTGTGTQWCASSPQPNSQQSEIQQLAAGTVALLKGSAWQGNAHGALWHRSPPMESATGSDRLLLTLDPIGD